MLIFSNQQPISGYFSMLIWIFISKYLQIH